MNSLRYGSSTIDFDLSPNWVVDWINPPEIQNKIDPAAIIENAFAQPVGFEKKLQLVSDKFVAITINDNTRPVPNNLFIPPLIKFLTNHGINKKNIHLFIANGTHEPMRPDNYSTILPEEIIRDFEIHTHNCDDHSNLTFCGTTSRNTRVFANTQFYTSDIKIVTGTIEPHHFMGYSGGVKSAAIGLAGRETITANHSFLLDPHAKSAEFEQNPMRQDVEEIGEIMGIDLAFNVVLSPDKTLGGAFWGSPKEVMQKGISVARKLCMVPTTKKFDLVIVSAGGYPKDINLYQAQKAMTNASIICKDGGTIVLVAECRDGVGSEAYYEFMQGVSTFKDAQNKFLETGFIIGQHKAALVANIGIKQNIILVSSIDADIVKSLLITPANSFRDAILKIGGKDNKIFDVAIIPYGSTTLPYYETEAGKTL